MIEDRKSFVFYESFEKAISNLPDELDQLKMYKAITNRSLYGKEPELSGVLNCLYELIKPQIEANEQKYINGNKGGAPKGNKNALKKKQPKINRKQPKNNLKQPNVNENDNDNDNDNENDNDNVNVILPVSDEPKTEKETKHKYGTYKNVLLTDKDIEKLKEKFPSDYLQKIENLSEGIELKGYKYKNYYLALIKWSQNENKSQKTKEPDLTDPERYRKEFKL